MSLDTAVAEILKFSEEVQRLNAQLEADSAMLIKIAACFGIAVVPLGGGFTASRISKDEPEPPGWGATPLAAMAALLKI